MNIGRWAIVIIGCMLFFGIGYKAGEYVEAGGLTPGSSGDPLAAKSYVDKAVSDKITQLQTQADGLQSKITSLQQTVDKLQAKINTSTSTTTVQSSTPEAAEKPQADQSEQPEPVVTDVKPTGQTAIIAAPSANIRKGPGTNYEIVAGLLKGKSVPVLKIQGDWVSVNLGNVQGWVSKSLVEIK